MVGNMVFYGNPLGMDDIWFGGRIEFVQLVQCRTFGSDYEYILRGLLSCRVQERPQLDYHWIGVALFVCRFWHH